MRCSKAAPGLAVEVFVEENQLTPGWIVRKPGLAAVAGACVCGVGQEEGGEPTPDFAGGVAERARAGAAVRGRQLDGDAVAVEMVVAFESLGDAGLAGTIEESRARTVCTVSGERIAIFRHEGKLSAVTNLCAHQGGPLGEGKVIDGCITCPWHGWQYRPGDGCSPPPFKEKLATYQVRVVKGRVEVNPKPLPPGTPTTPAPIEETNHE